MSTYYLMTEDQQVQGFDSLRAAARRIHTLRGPSPIQLRAAWVEREAEPSGAAIAIRKVSDSDSYGDLVAWLLLPLTADVFERLRAALDATVPLHLIYSKEG